MPSMERQAGSMSTLFSESGKLTPEERTLADMTARSSPLVVADDVTKEKALFDAEKADATAQPDKIMSCSSATINLINTIFGTGMLTFPEAFSAVGAGMGILILVFSAFMTHFAVVLLMRSAQKLRLDTNPRLAYYTVARKLMPNSRSRILVIDFAIAMMTFCVATAFLIVIGDTVLPAVMGAVAKHNSTLQPWQAAVQLPEVLQHRQIWTAFFCAVMIPLAFLKRLDSLKFTAILSFMSVFYVLIAMVHFVATMGEPVVKKEGFVWFKGTLKIFSKLPLFIFTFCCLQNVFTVRNEMKDVTTKKTKVASGSALTFTSVLYIAVAIAGYMAFGTQAEENVIKSYPGKDIVFIVARIMLAGLVCCAYPLQIHPCRNSVYRIWLGLTKQDAEKTIDGKAFYVITALLVACTITVGMTVQSISKVLSVAGAIGGVMLVYVLPGTFYLLASKGERYDVMKVSAWITILLGVFFAVVGIATTFIEIN